MARQSALRSVRAVSGVRPPLGPLGEVATAYLLGLGQDLAEAVDVDAVASAAAARTRELGRAAAVGVLDDAGEDVVVLGSSGYGCDAMTAGTRIPVASGLPIAEAAATGEAVLRGPGAGAPRWVAVPLADLGGALLLSDPGPEFRTGDVVAVQRGAALVAAALRRARDAEATAGALAAVVEPLRPASPGVDAVPGLRLATLLRPQDADRGLGGDVLAALPDGAGGGWLVVADVRGHGIGSSVLAAQLRAATGVLAPLVRGPAALLAGLDRAVQAALPEPDDPDAPFATAVVVHVRADGPRVVLRTASAGHPLPLVRTGAGVRPLGEPGVLLGVGLAPERGRAEHVVCLEGPWLLALHSDGLLDVPVPGAGEPRVLAALARTPLATAPEDVAHALLAAGLPSGVGAPDDVALLVAAPLDLPVAGPPLPPEVLGLV